MSLKCASCGFSLAELAIVLLISTLLLGGMLVPLSAQNDLRKTAETRKSLHEVRDALQGFAIANGRLPCPAVAAATGIEAGGGAAACAGAANGVADGFLPGMSLGLSPSDGQGYLQDAWGNRIRYAVTVAPSAAPNAFTTSKGISNFWHANGTPPGADLQICTNSASIGPPGTAKADCSANDALTKSAVAVIYSIGKNSAAAGADEAANLNGDRVFVSHEARPAGASGGEFDDLVVWLSANILYNRMVAAGSLP
jgi:type II secretory pathway pseudopilin PulG